MTSIKTIRGEIFAIDRQRDRQADKKDKEFLSYIQTTKH